jgi:predicted RNA-binding protein YlqC (UPF0109 family)
VGQVKELVDYMVRPLVRHPEDLSIMEVEGSASLLVELRVNDDDLAAVRGPDREMIKSLQQIVAASGGARKIVLDLIEENPAGEE